MAQIFISYRRHDSAYLAATLSDKLQQHFGPNSVFFDIDNIPLGVDFREYIGNAVGQCDVLLVIIGDQWMGSTSDGKRRIDEPSDYVRIEIESALKRNIPIIPVLIEEATMPSPAELPPSIESISFRNAAEIRAGRDLRQHIEQLVHGLEAIMKTSPAVGATADEKRSLPQTKTEALEKLSAPKETARKKSDDAKQRSSKKQADAPGLSEKSEKADERAAVTSGSADLLVEIQKVLSDFTDSHLYLRGAIPPSKLANARSKYPANSSPKDVLLFLDNTVFGGGKSSLILTSDAVYWFNNISGSNGRISYVDIKTVHTRGSKGFFDSAKILINQEEIELFVGDTSELAPALANVIRYLVKQQKRAS